MLYSNEEKVEMLLIYGECGKNSARALQLYAARYPEKTTISTHLDTSRHMFARQIENLCETGSINPRKRNRRKTRTDEAAEVAVLGAVANNPHLSTRQIESYSGISKTSVHRILKRHKFHIYHVSLHQELNGNGFQNREQFCQGIPFIFIT
jgi:predicted transcriptional regulator